MLVTRRVREGLAPPPSPRAPPASVALAGWSRPGRITNLDSQKG